MRICSLVPGATEVVATLGLADDLVGISHECDYPREIQHKPVMVRAAIETEQASSPEIDQRVRAALTDGHQLYHLDEALFARARPDLVITQDLCHVCAVTPPQLRRAVDTLPKPPQLLTLNATRLDQVVNDIQRIGNAIGRAREAQTLVAALRARLDWICNRVGQLSDRPTVACIEWLDPLFSAGHWVPDMVAAAGGKDTLANAGESSHPITWEQLVTAGPDVLVLMPCGFSIDRTLREIGRVASRPEWTRLPAVRHDRVFAVEAGCYFSRPGPRLIEGVALLAALCHPSLFGDHVPPGAHRIAGC